MRYKVVVYTRYKGKSKVYPSTGHEGPEGESIQLYSFFNFGCRRYGLSPSRPGRFTAGKDPVPIVYEAGWAPIPVWTDEENLVPTGNRSPDGSARNELLYRLSYPGPQSRYMAPLIRNLGAILGWVVKIVLPPLDCRDPNPVSIK
jgi:hypothetical protein